MQHNMQSGHRAHVTLQGHSTPAIILPARLSRTCPATSFGHAECHPGGARQFQAGGLCSSTGLTKHFKNVCRPFVKAAAAQAPSVTSSDIGIVIVDHGSRKKTSNEMLVHFGLVYQQMTGASIVEIAHMEIAEPTIAQAIEKCAAAGAKTVVIAPYFLSRGRHIQEDIPALVSEAQALHPGLKCVIADPVGVDPMMAQVIHNRVEAALAHSAQ